MSITFEYLRNLQENEQKEKYTLQKINDNFYNELKNYLAKINENYTKEEKQNIKSIIKTIFELRLNKLIKIAKLSLNNQMNIENATLLEKKFIDQIKSDILNYQNQINDKVYSFNSLENLEKKQDNNNKKIKVKFTNDVFSFVMNDMKTYGPFKKGQIEMLEKNIVDLLMKNKKVEVIKD